MLISRLSFCTRWEGRPTRLRDNRTWAADRLILSGRLGSDVEVGTLREGLTMESHIREDVVEKHVGHEGPVYNSIN